MFKKQVLGLFMVSALLLSACGEKSEPAVESTVAESVEETGESSSEESVEKTEEPAETTSGDYTISGEGEQMGVIMAFDEDDYYIRLEDGSYAWVFVEEDSKVAEGLEVGDLIHFAYNECKMMSGQVVYLDSTDIRLAEIDENFGLWNVTHYGFIDRLEGTHLYCNLDGFSSDFELTDTTVVEGEIEPGAYCEIVVPYQEREKTDYKFEHVQSVTIKERPEAKTDFVRFDSTNTGIVYYVTLSTGEDARVFISNVTEIEEGIEANDLLKITYGRDASSDGYTAFSLVYEVAKATDEDDLSGWEAGFYGKIVSLDEETMSVDVEDTIMHFLLAGAEVEDKDLAVDDYVYVTVPYFIEYPDAYIFDNVGVIRRLTDEEYNTYYGEASEG